MKTCLFSTSFLDGQDALGNDRFLRTLRYVNYYRSIQEEIGFDDIWFADNASNIYLWMCLSLLAVVNIHRYETQLLRGQGNDYPYCWRGIYFLNDLIKMGYKKIIICDTDAFILTRTMANYVRLTTSGYTTMWSNTYQFPASEISILCQDAFHIFQQFCETPWQERSDSKVLFESAMPYTHICKNMVGDRFGEFSPPIQQQPWMDWFSQANLHNQLVFNRFS